MMDAAFMIDKARASFASSQTSLMVCRPRRRLGSRHCGVSLFGLRLARRRAASHRAWRPVHWSEWSPRRCSLQASRDSRPPPVLRGAKAAPAVNREPLRLSGGLGIDAAGQGAGDQEMRSGESRWGGSDKLLWAVTSWSPPHIAGGLKSGHSLDEAYVISRHATYFESSPVRPPA